MEIKELEGLIITAIESTPDEIKFATKDGSVYRMCHHQDCCESVGVEDIIGDLDDLIDNPVLKAEEVTSRENPLGIEKDYQDSFTWTFYHIATIKGHVTIRWYGESNGYYSESVDFDKIN